MAMSGVLVSDEAVNEFNNIKLKHMYRYVQLKLSDDLKTIDVEKTVETAGWDDFVHQMPANDCRYAVYDFDYDMGESGQREQLIFVVWCPDTANVRKKMLYASSKDALRKKFVGINHEIQATEYSELNQRDVTEKIKCKMVK